MTMNYQSPRGHGGGENNGPPGQKLLCVSLALLAAILGTPALFHLIGPLVERLVYEAYGSRDFAEFMYVMTFGLSGIVIFAISQMALWYAITAVVALGALRFAGIMA